jgi:short-subunit dehydrogenase
MKWDGTTAIITGASRGIGAATARAAAAKGARVGLLARSKADLDEVLRACGGRGAVAACDVGERASVTEAIASLERELGPADILVNNAGAGNYSKIADTGVEVFERLMKINYLGTVYATKAVLPGMLARGRGHIVNIASINGRIGAPMEAAYSGSKFAVAALSEALWFEAGPRGVGVSLVNPGPVATEFFNARGVAYARTFPKPVKAEKIADAVVRAVERGQFEVFIPAWLRFPPAMKALFPPMFRRGTARSFRKELGG